jgi:hypothetical protein
MKALVVLFALFWGSNLLAQTTPRVYHARPADSSTFLGFHEATAGPFFTGGVSRMNENIPTGWHTDPAFAYTFGGLLALELNEWVGFQFGLAYDARGLYMAKDSGGVTADMGVQYLSILPSIRLFWLVVGLAFNLPMSGSATVNIDNYSNGQAYTENRNIANSDIQSGMDLRGGLSIPVYRAESGVLHILVTGSFPMSKVLSNTTSFDTTTNHVFKGLGEGPLPAVRAGISYQFDLSKMK